MHSQDVRNQGRLAAEAEQHARDVKERNRFMRQIAAQSGVMQLPGLSLVVMLPSHWICEMSGTQWNLTTKSVLHTQPGALSAQRFSAGNCQHQVVLVSN